MNEEETKPIRAWVLDDDERSVKDWAASLEKGAESASISVEATPVYGKELVELVKELYERSIAFRKGDSHCEDSTFVDECDLLVIDSDLRSQKEVGLVSGLDLAYSARCFTDVGCIVVLNAFGENPFDLTLLGHRRSFADLHLGSKQLENPGLWTLDRESGFRPWAWPLLHREAQAVRGRRDWLRERLDEPISDLFGFDEVDRIAMPRSMASFLTTVRDRKRATGDDSLETITPTQFVLESEFGLSRRDSEAIASDGEGQRTVIARAAAARLTKWLYGILVAGQDILVDAPHMVSRFPSTVEGDGIDAFNRVVELGAGESWEEVPSELGLKDDRDLKDSFFEVGPWADRPLWRGQRLARSGLLEAQKPWEFASPGFAFCEDVSRFVPEAEAEKFACDLETPYRIRYIAKQNDEVTYRPRENLVTD